MTVAIYLLAFGVLLVGMYAVVAKKNIVKIIVAMLDTPFIYLSRTSWFRPRDTATTGP